MCAPQSATKLLMESTTMYTDFSVYEETFLKGEGKVEALRAGRRIPAPSKST